MNVTAFFNSELFNLLILPLLICLARICDVTIGTVRIIVVSKGKKILASVLGFFEVLIWITAICQIMKNLNNPACYIGYAAGFALGNFIGITVEEKLAMGTLVVRVFTPNGISLMNNLKAAGFGVTCIDAHGTTGPVNVVYTIIKRSDFPIINRIIKQFNPQAFFSVEELRAANNGVFPMKAHHHHKGGYFGELRGRYFHR